MVNYKNSNENGRPLLSISNTEARILSHTLKSRASKKLRYGKRVQASHLILSLQRKFPAVDMTAIDSYDRNPVTPYSLIGSDNRIQLEKTTVAPWCRICCLEISVKNRLGYEYGTGWLAGPRTVITAGHCVFDPDKEEWVEHIRVIPGRDNFTEPFPNAVTGTMRFSSTQEWVESGDPRYDIAVLHLDKSIGDIVGWFGFAALDDTALRQYKIESAGYPSDSRFEGRRMAYHSGKVLAVDDRRIYYNVDTEKGNSGSPVFLYPTGRENEPVVVATHTNSEYATPAHLNIEANSAPRILPDVYDLIEEWIRQDEGGS
ncbi:MAG: hypothetical protein D3909_08120 [Candidatus Electrothrix sp. ATG1]|nr:hypothetical protein [Candidatus Electrothrix sp. ATG1]